VYLIEVGGGGGGGAIHGRGGGEPKEAMISEILEWHSYTYKMSLVPPPSVHLQLSNCMLANFAPH
jgi:hypothetical protein